MRGTFTHHNTDFAADVLHLADLGFKQISVEPVVAKPEDWYSIKEEDIPHAFDRFYKARNEHNKSGSGLGLAIAKQIAQRHDMQLQLQSKLGEGTTIIITLPPELKEKEYADE